MQTRAAYEFKTFLAFYNFFQVILCIFFLVNAIGAGYRLDYLWKCYKPGFYNMALVKLLYMTYFIKALELIETICFALRKKFKQMSFLHIYHHASTLIFVYLAFKKGTSKCHRFFYSLPNQFGMHKRFSVPHSFFLVGI
jgi:GNS1/SUR4 family